MILLRQNWGIKPWGIPLSIELSCLPVLLVWSLVFSQLSGVSSLRLGWGMGFLTALLLLVSVLLHEVGRAIAGRAYAMTVQSIVFRGFGSTTTFQQNYQRPLQLLEVSLAGSLVNLSIFVLLSGLASLRFNLGESLLTLVDAIKVINATLGLFHFIPGLPLDGARALRALLWGKSGKLPPSYPWLAQVGYAASAIAIAVGLYYIGQHKLFGGVLLYLGLWACITHPQTVLLRRGKVTNLRADSPVLPKEPASSATKRSPQPRLRSIPSFPKLANLDAKFLDCATPSERFTQGMHYVENAKFQAAATIFDQAIQADKDCAEAYHNRGNAYLKVRDSQSALEDFKSALRHGLHHSETYLGQGIAYAGTNDLQGAIMAYSEALRLDPDCLSAYLNRANAYAEMGQHQKAIADYRLAEKCPAHLCEQEHLEKVRQFLNLLQQDT